MYAACCYLPTLRTYLLVERKNNCHRGRLLNLLYLCVALNWDVGRIPRYGSILSLMHLFDAMSIDIPASSCASTWKRFSILAAIFLSLSPIGHAQGTGQTALGLDALNSTSNVPETAHTRRVFYLGGQYTGPANATKYTGQVYTEELLPVGGPKRPNPLVLFHAGFASGAQWLQTPDNRKGWASYFLDQGFAVYLVDVASVGRSSRLADEPVAPPTSLKTFEDAFSAPEKAKPKPLYPQGALHNQFPGVSRHKQTPLMALVNPFVQTGQRGDPIFDLTYASVIATPSRYNDTETAVTNAVCALLSRIGTSFLIAHAYGGFFPLAIADRCPTKVQGIFGMDVDPQPFRGIDGSPSKPWGLTDIPLTYDPAVNDPVADLPHTAVGNSSLSFSSCQLQQAPAKKLSNLAEIPIMQIIAEGGPHAVYGHCQPAYLRQAGVPVSLVYLADVGIRGNGQLMHIEKNNLDIAAFADKWFQSREGEAGKGNLTDVSSGNGTVAALDNALGLFGTALANNTSGGPLSPRIVSAQTS